MVRLSPKRLEIETQSQNGKVKHRHRLASFGRNCLETADVFVEFVPLVLVSFVVVLVIVVELFAVVEVLIVAVSLLIVCPLKWSSIGGGLIKGVKLLLGVIWLVLEFRVALFPVLESRFVMLTGFVPLSGLVALTLSVSLSKVKFSKATLDESFVSNVWNESMLLLDALLTFDVLLTPVLLAVKFPLEIFCRLDEFDEMISVVVALARKLRVWTIGTCE
jgi:hypothetical protein